jgi:hypothetical protein
LGSGQPDATRRTTYQHYFIVESAHRMPLSYQN